MTGPGTSNGTIAALKTAKQRESRMIVEGSLRLRPRAMFDTIFGKGADLHTLLPKIFFPQTSIVSREFSTGALIASLTARTTR